MKDKSRIGVRALLAVLVVAALGIAAPTAGAVQLEPGSHDFGSQTVATTSAPYPFTLTVICHILNPDLSCAYPDAVVPEPSAHGSDFAQTNNCPPLLASYAPFFPVSCTINVTFTPAATGSRSGYLLAAGDLMAGLSGTGLAAPALPPAPAPASPAPTTQPSTFNLQAAIKRCKKTFPKGPKRKKCIRKAKQRAGLRHSAISAGRNRETPDSSSRGRS